MPIVLIGMCVVAIFTDTAVIIMTVKTIKVIFYVIIIPYYFILLKQVKCEVMKEIRNQS